MDFTMSQNLFEFVLQEAHFIFVKFTDEDGPPLPPLRRLHYCKSEPA
jgi:hypothetical protein